MLVDVRDHDRGGVKVVRRDVEETLYLAGMQIDGQHAVGAGPLDEVGHQLGGDRRARPGFAILPGIAEIGHHRRDPARRSPAQRIDQDQQFHQVVIGGKGGRLDDEDIRAAHVLLHLHEDLHVGEAPHETFRERHVEIGRDGLRQRTVGVSRDKFHDGPFHPACTAGHPSRPG